MEGENNKAMLLYEWDCQHKHLEFAVKKAELQLANVNKRLRHLRVDLASYIALTIVPVLVFLLIGLITARLPILYTLVFFIMELFRRVMLFLYIIMLPFFLYNLIKTVILLYINREREDILYTLPGEEKISPGKEPAREDTYQKERQKLLLILNRYYLYQDILEQLKTEIDKEPCTLTKDELKARISGMIYYEEIRPASDYVGRTAKTVSILAILIIVIPILISLIYSIVT